LGLFASERLTATHWGVLAFRRYCGPLLSRYGGHWLDSRALEGVDCLEALMLGTGNIFGFIANGNKAMGFEDILELEG